MPCSFLVVICQVHSNLLSIHSAFLFTDTVLTFIQHFVVFWYQKVQRMLNVFHYLCLPDSHSGRAPGLFELVATDSEYKCSLVVLFNKTFIRFWQKQCVCCKIPVYFNVNAVLKRRTVIVFNIIFKKTLNHIEQQLKLMSFKVNEFKTWYLLLVFKICIINSIRQWCITSRNPSQVGDLT